MENSRFHYTNLMCIHENFLPQKNFSLFEYELFYGMRKKDNFVNEQILKEQIQKEQKENQPKDIKNIIFKQRAPLTDLNMNAKEFSPREPKKLFFKFEDCVDCLLE